MAQSIKATVSGLYAACVTVYTGQTGADGSPVLVTYGPPSTYQPEVIVAVGMATRQPVTRPTAGTNRSREKAAEVDVVISVFVPGGDVAARTAVEKCDDLAELLEAHFRTSPNETLGGGCREAFVSRVEGPIPDVVVSPDSGAVTGRVAESTVTVTAFIRQ